jgi:hypothetical protein
MFVFSNLGHGDAAFLQLRNEIIEATQLLL